jgi:hypothetical protein
LQCPISPLDDATNTNTRERSPHRSLPQLSAVRPYLTDGGLETTLVFRQGLDLPDFASFPLLDAGEGQASLVAYCTPYLDLAERSRSGFVPDTPTWRANLDWAPRLPAVISFTVESDGRLPSGQALGEAIAQVDGAPVAWLPPTTWSTAPTRPTSCTSSRPAPVARPDVLSARADASRLSHASLDGAAAFDRGDIDELGRLDAALGHQ